MGNQYIKRKQKNMGGGIAGWLTPGWMVNDARFQPHIAQPNYVADMLKAGENPKDLVLEECKPQCTHWREKLERCESSLVQLIKVNPTKSCMYPFRDWATCVEACTQPTIHNKLVGTH